MRMRAVLAAAALGVLLVGCTTVPRAVDRPLVIPPDIAWRYAMSCVSAAGDVGVDSLAWSNAGAEVHLDLSADPAVDTAALEDGIEACLTAHPYGERDSFVDPYERSRLYEYYISDTIPCLARQGIDITPAPRSQFDEKSGGEPWNPYLGMDMPFDDLLELYNACPPRPASLGIETDAG